MMLASWTQVDTSRRGKWFWSGVGGGCDWGGQNLCQAFGFSELDLGAQGEEQEA